MPTNFRSEATRGVSRRVFLSGAAVAATGVFGSRAAAQAILTDDGVYRQPWFLESFLELGPDLEEATSKGKRFMITWELKGCPGCKATHLVNFARPDIVDFVRDRFEVLQLNLIGSREVIDFDGEKLPEKRLAEKYGVRGTPTFQFFPERAEGLAAKPARDREVARAEGYLKPNPFLAMFRFVDEHGYEREGLDAFLKSSSS